MTIMVTTLLLSLVVKKKKEKYNSLGVRERSDRYIAGGGR